MFYCREYLGHCTTVCNTLASSQLNFSGIRPPYSSLNSSLLIGCRLVCMLLFLSHVLLGAVESFIRYCLLIADNWSVVEETFSNCRCLSSVFFLPVRDSSPGVLGVELPVGGPSVWLESSWQVFALACNRQQLPGPQEWRPPEGRENRQSSTLRRRWYWDLPATAGAHPAHLWNNSRPVNRTILLTDVVQTSSVSLKAEHWR